MNKLETREILEKLMSMYDCVEEVYLNNKEALQNRKRQEKANFPDTEFECPSLSYISLQRRNGLVSGNPFSFNTNIIDTQSQLSYEQSSLMADNLSVSSANYSTSIRFEELCLILLRGSMERLSLQISPCQNRISVYARGIAHRIAGRLLYNARK